MLKKRRVVLLVPLALFLVFGLGLNLSRAQSGDELGQESGLPVISMDFQDADLKDVLKVFSQQAGLNFIASESVKERRVTLYLDKVSVEDALNTIMTANSLSYEQKKDSKIFIVKEWGRPEVETITKVFPLQYARVKGYELTAAGQEARQSEEIGIKEVIEKIVSQFGQVIEDSRTNSLIVTDVRSQFPKIEKTIKELDIKLPQVMIEAEIIEASLETIDKLGIEWGTATDGIVASAYGAGRSSTFPFTKPNNMRKVGPAGNVDNLYLGYISAMNLGGTLAMLARDTDSKILARPKVLTLNNETAEIKITAETVIASEQQEIASTGGGIDRAIVSPERVETGVTLKVTPQINTQGEITMIIEPSVINTKVSSILANALDPHTRSVKTTVTVADGETVIIGGLINTEDEKIMRKVPFLGDIPLLGSLFCKKDDSSEDKELIIFITPHLAKERARMAGLTSLKRHLPPEGYGDFVQSAMKKEEAMESILDILEK
ncbi:MAG: hypothetical protein JSV30_02665 [Candidatus Omnitrophota bacterium]|nr:MAG: hypothetical protein JSV30_02665 [Candidatus Omnitrophota bacterium]